MSKIKMIINGRYLVRNLTGQERFATEIVKYLDKFSKPGEFELVCPVYTSNVPTFLNIIVTKYGMKKREAWEQIDFVKIVKSRHVQTLNLTTTCSIKYPGVTCIHDLLQEVHPEWFPTLYGKFSTMWHKIIVDSIQKRGKAILTVSFFSKNEILSQRKINQPIYVLGNGWEHINDVTADPNVLKKNNLKQGDFFFTLGSLTPQKNIKWIIEVGKRNPNYIFVVGGGINGLTNDNLSAPNNVKFIGRIADGEIKQLMLSCKAYLSPSIHEGFGIPPLEALACGAKIIIADASCYNEIFKKAAFYFNPYNYEIDLKKALSYKGIGTINILDYYSWPKFSKKLLSFLRDNSYFNQ